MSPLWSIARATCSCSADDFVSVSSRSMSWRNAQSASVARFASRPSVITLAAARQRLVPDALERRIVVAVRDEPQVRQSVLDLGALEEPQTPVHAVRNAAREQPFLE